MYHLPHAGVEMKVRADEPDAKMSVKEKRELARQKKREDADRKRRERDDERRYSVQSIICCHRNIIRTIYYLTFIL